jgi:hypothetical protein
MHLVYKSNYSTVLLFSSTVICATVLPVGVLVKWFDISLRTHDLIRSAYHSHAFRRDVIGVVISLLILYNGLLESSPGLLLL